MRTIFKTRGIETVAATVRGVSRVDRSGERVALAFDTPDGVVRLEMVAGDADWLAQAIIANRVLSGRKRLDQEARCHSSI